MTRFRASIALVALGMMTAGSGCKVFKEPIVPDTQVQNVLSKYIKDQKYEPFAIPRSDWGTGTIIAFTDGAEDIKAFNHDCFKLQLNDPNGYSENNASLTNTSYTISSSDDISAALAKGVSAQLELSGAFKDSRVKAISISLAMPKEAAASEVALDRRIAAIIAAQDQACIRQIFGDANYVIDRVLSVGAIDVSFKGKDDQLIKIDADLLKAIKLNVQTSSSLIGEAGLKASDTRMIGYRLYKYKSAGGFAEGQISKVRIDPAKAQEMRAASSR